MAVAAQPVAPRSRGSIASKQAEPRATSRGLDKNRCRQLQACIGKTQTMSRETALSVRTQSATPEDQLTALADETGATVSALSRGATRCCKAGSRPAGAICCSAPTAGATRRVSAFGLVDRKLRRRLRVKLCQIGDFPTASGLPPIAVMAHAREHFRVVPLAEVTPMDSPIECQYSLRSS
jgi:hypothetical protein